VTSLGEYWQGDPEHPPTMPTTAGDWDEMAARGLSVVRLVVHWSRIEPEKGEIDESYLDEVDEYVRAAAERGIYTVVDMHQDAYTAYIFTEEGTDCPEGTRPAKGWDGAPEWAVFTDGLSTCTPGERNASDAVRTAWNHFYDNRDGIRDRFAASWGAVAARFAGRAEVAGYDIINEPEVPRPLAELKPLYEVMLRESVAAIREAEDGAPFEHLVFIEPALPAGNPDFGLIFPSPESVAEGSRGVVWAPHNYAETIGVEGLSMTFEALNTFYLSFAARFGVPTWIGEYGFWNTSESTLEKLSRYARDEDKHRLGGAWWQWRQPCGDPHSVGPEGEFVITHLHKLGCPGDKDLGPTEPFLKVLGRGYPRAAPGRLTRLLSDPETGALEVEAEVEEAGGTLVVWSPTSPATHGVVLAGLEDLEDVGVSGGRILTAKVAAPGEYSLRVEPR